MRRPVIPARWKQPDEVRLLTFDFTSKLGAGDHVTAVVGNAIEAPAGITVSAPSLNGNKVTAFVSGGAADTEYRVTCRVTTQLAETLELTVDVEILDGAN